RCGGNTPAGAVRRTPQPGRWGTSACGCPTRKAVISEKKKIESAEARRLCSPQASADAFDFWVEWTACPRIEQTGRGLMEAICVPTRIARASAWIQVHPCNQGFQRFQEKLFPVRWRPIEPTVPDSSALRRDLSNQPTAANP
ncbi:MAG: hypothetical protein ACK6AT_06885, partial [Planctomycetota bacterium]